MSGSDRDSLVFFYEEFAGERWFKAMNWCSELPCGRWHGVEMGAGHCTSLKLTSNNLYGKFPDSKRLRSLINLENLYLDCNAISGCIPRSVAFLPNVQELNLSWNRLEGPIPEELFLLKKLRVLRIDNNLLSGPIPIGICELDELKYLDLSGNALSGFFPWAECGARWPKIHIFKLTPNPGLEGFLPERVEELRAGMHIDAVIRLADLTQPQSS